MVERAGADAVGARVVAGSAGTPGDGSGDGSGGRPRSATATRILDAALARFADRGVEATSLDSLAAEIGIRKQTILYWFPSKELLLEAVIDHAVAELGAHLTAAVRAEAGPLDRQVAAAVDATFRLGRTRPELLALVREVSRLGPGALGRLRVALAPLLDTAAAAVTGAAPAAGAADRVRPVLVEAGAQVVGLATEAEVRAAVGHPPDLVWLRRRRATLIAEVTTALQ